MKILLTGMTSSQIHESTKRQGLTLAGALAKALRGLGHEVDVRAPIFDDAMRGDEDYDFYWVGLGPVKGLGTSYMYGALATIYRQANLGKLAVYLDDTDSKKIGSEFRSVTRRPADLVKPFFSYKRDWQKARQPENFPHILMACDMLGGKNVDLEHPPIYVPAWHFDLAFQAATLVSANTAANLFTADPSVYFKVELDRFRADTRYWATMWQPESTAITNMGVRLWDVEPISRFSWGPLSGASGLLVPSATWVPELHIAASIGVPSACHWRTMGPLFGTEFEHLPANMETLTESELTDIAKAQYTQLLKQSTTKAKMMTTLKKAMEEASK